ncbi:MAG: hypothetical protein ABW185_11520, partial [Sedimenticola sp.]
LDGSDPADMAADATAARVQELLVMDSVPSPSTSHGPHSVTGMASFPNVPAASTMSSYDLAIGAFVPDKIKQAIWNNQFVDLAHITDTKCDDDVLIRVAGQHISMTSKAKDTSKLLTIGQWLTAFHIFMDIYVQKYPGEISGLLSYCNLVRDLERAHGVAAFNFYDRTFRAHRQSQPLPWGRMHTELWVKATTLSASAAGSGVASPLQRSKKSCHNFNKVSGCTFRNCKYAHVCSFCEKRHSRVNCFALKRTENVATSSATSGAVGFVPPSKPTNQPFRGATNANASKK